MTISDLIAAVIESKEAADDMTDIFDFEDETDEQWAMFFIASLKELGFDVVHTKPRARNA